MARVDMTVNECNGPNPTDGVTATVTAADATNKQQFSNTGREIIVARNSGAGARTVTIESVADERGRELDITADSIAAGATHIYGPFDPDGWNQTDGKLYFEAEHAEVLFNVIRLPD